MTVGPTLPHEVTPEDLALGYLWGSRFRSAYDEVAKGGEISGNPLINKGVKLNGTSDYIKYKLNKQFSGKDPFSFHLIITPDIPFDNGVTRYIFDASPSVQYSFVKSSTPLLVLYIGGTAIFTVDASATWLQNKKNLFTVLSTSGYTDCLHNGVKIVDADTSAWTPSEVTEIHIGQRSTNANRFSGEIEFIKFYNRLIPEIEHKNLWNAMGAMI